MHHSTANKRFRLCVIGAAACLVLVACGDDATRTAAPVEITTTTVAAEDDAATTEDDVQAPAPDASGPGCDALGAGVTSITLDSGGADHDVKIFVPSSFSGQPLPAVVNWHGLGSNGPEQAAYSGYEAVAETEGFIAVHPTGVPAPGDTRNSWELADDQDQTRDDLAFAVELFDDLIAQWCVDGDRIFSTGMSNGGFFTARLVCEIPERLAGAISVAGVYHPPSCAPTESVPFRAYHGTADAVVPFDGSGESSLSGTDDAAASEFFSQVMPEEFGEFAADAGCGEPTESTVSPQVIRYDYPDCDVDMAFFEVVAGGHTWPGSPLAAVTEGLGFTTVDVSATVDGWSFFASIG